MNQPAITREDLILSQYKRDCRDMEKLLRDVHREWEDTGNVEDVVYRISDYLRGIDGP